MTVRVVLREKQRGDNHLPRFRPTNSDQLDKIEKEIYRTVLDAVDEIPEMVEQIKIEQTIPNAKFEKYKKRLTSEEDYHQRVEARINDLITKLENKEIKLSDLSDNDRNVIIDILNQND